MIYLDNSATTYPKPKQVYDALDYANKNLSFNSGRGLYKESHIVNDMITDTRRKIGELVNKDPSKVVFTSSATESLNMIINGIDFQDGDNVFISPFEHNAIVRPLYNLKKKINININILPFDKITWKPELETMDQMFAYYKPKAVFVSQISNATGLMIDYKNIFSISKKYKAVNVLDSAQAFGVINPNLDNCDFCVFAGHKSLYASFGVAGFIINSKFQLNIYKSGGNGSDSMNHEMPLDNYNRFESGSLNSVAIYALNKSCDWLHNADVSKHEALLTTYLVTKLRNNEKIIMYLPLNENDVIGIVSFNVVGYSPEDVANILDQEFDIKVRAGYHCAPFVHDFIGSNVQQGTVRVSMGAFNTVNDIDTLIGALKSL